MKTVINAITSFHFIYASIADVEEPIYLFRFAALGPFCFVKVLHVDVFLLNAKRKSS